MNSKEQNELFFSNSFVQEKKFDYTIRPDIFMDSEKILEKYNKHCTKQQWTWIDDFGHLL